MTGGGVEINYYPIYTDKSRTQQEFRSEGERERRRERVKVREMPVIKPSPDSLGRLGELRDWALGQKQVVSELTTVSSIPLSGPSVSWDSGC